MLVLIDNYDSFTYNVVQYLGDVGADVRVFRNDKVGVDELLSMNPQGFVISPGPGDPDEAGVSLDLIRVAGEKKIPLLGICLGHQAIGQTFGGQVVRAPSPIHGKTSAVSHGETGLFLNVPSPFNVARYHSLIVEKSTFPSVLSIDAQTEDGLVMALSHKTLPIYGIQFHPESIATEYGHTILRNFVDKT